jgi:hypothetical protein
VKDVHFTPCIVYKTTSYLYCKYPRQDKIQYIDTGNQNQIFIVLKKGEHKGRAIIKKLITKYKNIINLY